MSVYLQSSLTTWLITLPSALPFKSEDITAFMICPLFLAAMISANFSVRNTFTSSADIKEGAYSLKAIECSVLLDIFLVRM